MKDSIKDILPVGKLNPKILESLFNGYIIKDPKVIVGPKVGEDAAVIDVGEYYLIAKTDPITFVTEEIGWYLVCVTGNDIATMGAVPRWLLVTVLLPEGRTTKLLAEDIFYQITTACEKFGITLCGGHTEITHNLDRPILVGQMLGLIEKDKLIKSSDAKIGDDILLTKGIAIEGTSIIARERENLLLERGYLPQYISKAKNYLKDPGISVIKDAIIASQSGGVHAMHDPTEGGLANGLHEIALCSNVGVMIKRDQINIFPECLDLCKEFNINPFGLIASGSLIIIADPSSTNVIIDRLLENNVSCSVIGKVVEKEKGICFIDDTEVLPYFDTDEITKIFN
ncbi:MAG: AIR synthase family protein [bacterium]